MKAKIGEMTPPASMSAAATPPSGNPYPQCTRRGWHAFRHGL